jgi:hypothetical protein
MKKFFYFLIFLVAISLLFFLYWYLSFRGTVPKIPFLPENPFGLFSNDVRPGGGGGDGGGGDDNTNDPNSTSTTPFSEENLFELVSKEPTAGYSFSDFVTTVYGSSTDSGRKTFATTTALLYVDRGTGHIYKKFIFKEDKAQKLTNTTVPGVYDAYFFANNTKVLMRYLRETDNTIISLYGALPPLSSSLTLPLREVTRLPENIVSVAVSPKTGDLYYLVKTTSGSSLYRITSEGDTKVRDYDLSELSLSFNKEDLILSQKPSAFEKTYFFTEDELSLYGGRTGQRVVFSAINKGVFLSSVWTEVGLQLISSDLSGKRPYVYTTQTVADKCLSSLVGSYFFCFVPNLIPLIPFGLPDDWYKGRISFNDSLFVLDTVRHEESKLSRLETDIGTEFDVFKPLISSRDNYLAFSNKLNSELWVAQLQKIIAR